MCVFDFHVGNERYASRSCRAISFARTPRLWARIAAFVAAEADRLVGPSLMEP